LFAFVGYFFVRVHLLIPVQYLKISSYLAGTERLPFQRRVLPIFLIRLLEHIPIPASIVKGHAGAFANANQIWLLLIDLVAFAVFSFFCHRFYRATTKNGMFSLLWYPILIFALVWSYVLHSEANLYYPYDMLSVAFFTAGLFFVYQRKFLPLLLVMLVGSFNRETTMFLIPLVALDALAPMTTLNPARLPWKRLPWLKLALLSAIWIGVKLLLGHFFQLNDRSQDFLRLGYNRPYLLYPNNWPQLLSGCGFLLPVVFLLRRRIPDTRVAAYMLIIPIWFIVMCFYGVLTETRIYGELCTLVAVACTLLLETYASSPKDAHA
jgi:hypothetical protein